MLLARTMGMPAAELAGRLTLEEFHEHWADWRLNPWGPAGDDLRQALLRAQVYHQFRGQAPAYKLDDFLIERPVRPAAAGADSADIAALRSQFRAWRKPR